MRKVYFILILIATLMLNSCTALAQVYYDDYGYYNENNVSYSHIIRYGTPYYVDNVISYYLYNNVYYYPYIFNGHHYFKPYHHIQPRGFIFHPEVHHRPDRHFEGPREHRYHNMNGHINIHTNNHMPDIRHNNNGRQINSSTRITVTNPRVIQPQRMPQHPSGRR